MVILNEPIYNTLIIADLVAKRNHILYFSHTEETDAIDIALFLSKELLERDLAEYVDEVTERVLEGDYMRPGKLLNTLPYFTDGIASELWFSIQDYPLNKETYKPVPVMSTYIVQSYSLLVNKEVVLSDYIAPHPLAIQKPEVIINTMIDEYLSGVYSHLDPSDPRVAMIKSINWVVWFHDPQSYYGPDITHFCLARNNLEITVKEKQILLKSTPYYKDLVQYLENSKEEFLNKHSTPNPLG